MRDTARVFRRRSEYVLALALSKGYHGLVSDAWVCQQLNFGIRRKKAA
jgi:hypothetical protein